MKHTLPSLLVVLAAASFNVHAQPPSGILDSLENYQVNSPTMISSGLPTEAQFIALKALGVNKVIDLIPGDRSDEATLMRSLGLTYHNVQVAWEHPTLNNFQQYVGYMQSNPTDTGITLTHCKLNWRGAVFTYLYRVTQLGHSHKEAKQDLLAIWQPDETWQGFIDQVLTHYQGKS